MRTDCLGHGPASLFLFAHQDDEFAIFSKSTHVYALAGLYIAHMQQMGPQQREPSCVTLSLCPC